jgi:predicted esterase
MNTLQAALRGTPSLLRAALICAAIATCACARVSASPQQGGAAAVASPTAQGRAPDAGPRVTRNPKTFKTGTLYSVWPSDADPTIKRFDKANLVLVPNNAAKNADLLVFFPGTGGDPNGAWPFLVAGADAGYRVIGLMYDNPNAVPVVCGPQLDPACSDRFREKRIFGDGVSTDIDDLPEESVVNRLVKLLQYLDKNFPGEGWGAYLANGAPNWARIAVSGHSQGGGVAAYIAKKEKVARVVVISGAWDRVNATKVFAPWVTSPSATPLDRWYATYHAKETNAGPISLAYTVIGIPPDHIRVLTLEPNPAVKLPAGVDGYHGSSVATNLTPVDANGAPAYAADWAFLLGHPK